MKDWPETPPLSHIEPMLPAWALLPQDPASLFACATAALAPCEGNKTPAAKARPRSATRISRLRGWNYFDIVQGFPKGWDIQRRS